MMSQYRERYVPAITMTAVQAANPSHSMSSPLSPRFKVVA
jgi:hypothetical protein